MLLLHIPTSPQQDPWFNSPESQHTEFLHLREITMVAVMWIQMQLLANPVSLLMWQRGDEDSQLPAMTVDNPRSPTNPT